MRKEAENVADAIGQGLLSPTLAQRLTKLEEQRAKLISTLSQLDETTNAKEFDPQFILQRYSELKRSPASPEYKEFIAHFLDCIIVGKYAVETTIQVGFGSEKLIELSHKVRRQIIYAQNSRN